MVSEKANELFRSSFQTSIIILGSLKKKKKRYYKIGWGPDDVSSGTSIFQKFLSDSDEHAGGEPRSCPSDDSWG